MTTSQDAPTEKATDNVNLANIRAILLKDKDYDTSTIGVKLIPINEYVAINAKDCRVQYQKDISSQVIVYRLIALKQFGISPLDTPVEAGQVGGYVCLRRNIVNPAAYTALNVTTPFWVDSKSTLVVYEKANGRFLVENSDVEVKNIEGIDRVVYIKNSVIRWSYIAHSTIKASYIVNSTVNFSTVEKSVMIVSSLNKTSANACYIEHSSAKEGRMRHSYLYICNFNATHVNESYVMSGWFKDTYITDSYVEFPANYNGRECGGAEHEFKVRYGVIHKPILTINRGDGYQFAVYRDINDGEIIIAAGCRRFTVKKANDHWAYRRPKGHPISKQTKVILKAIQEINDTTLSDRQRALYSRRLRKFIDFSYKIGEPALDGNNTWGSWENHKLSLNKTPTI